jgi:hypothetical protein
MASGADTCWRCGVEWATEDQPPTTLRLVPSDVDRTVAPVQPTTRQVAAAVRR